MVSLDYMKQKGVIHREKKGTIIINEKGSMPTIVRLEEENKWVSPTVAPAKEAEEYAIRSGQRN